MEDEKAIEVNDGIYWVGFGDEKAGFSNNPYLVVEEDNVVLFDPGSRRPEHFGLVKKKIESVVPVEKINYIVCHHQDPDLVASVPLFEEIIGVGNFELITTMRTSLLIPYYDIKSEVTTVDDGDALDLSDDRAIVFLTAPYLHFAGSHVSYDTKTKTLFSGDIFGAFSVDWSLFANENYIEAMRIFHEPYIAHKDIIVSFVNKVQDFGIEIDMVCPQHGSVIKDDIPKYIEALLSFKVGAWL